MVKKEKKEKEEWNDARRIRLGRDRRKLKILVRYNALPGIHHHLHRATPGQTWPDFTSTSTTT